MCIMFFCLFCKIFESHRFFCCAAEYIYFSDYNSEDTVFFGAVLRVTETEVIVFASFIFEESLQQDCSYFMKARPFPEGQSSFFKQWRVNGKDPRCAYLQQLLFNEVPLLSPAPFDDKVAQLGVNGDLNLFNKKLDASQQEAVRFSLCQPHLVVIHGPPGTGKTTTLVEIILQNIMLNKKVLVTAHANLAVDNIALKLLEYKVNMVRLGHPGRSCEELWPYSLEFMIKKYHADPETVLDEADVVLCTLTGAASCTIEFDLTIIDECAQSIEVDCYTAISRSPKLILAGDHNQLPPVVKNAEAKPLFISLMERIVALYGDAAVRMLTVQYRMHQDIMEWASNVTYDGKITAHPTVAGRLLCHLPNVQQQDNFTDQTLLLVDTHSYPGYGEDFELKSKSYYNSGEAAMVWGLVRRYVAAGLHQDQITVITPYKAQVELLQRHVHHTFPHVIVATVDSFQGRENDVIILSMVRSNDKSKFLLCISRKHDIRIISVYNLMF